MKHLTLFCLLLMLVTACNNPSSKRRLSHTENDISSTEISDDERIHQVENARYNRVLISGKWKLAKEKKNGEETSPEQLADRPTDSYLFLPNDRYAICKGKKIVQQGTYEWMAEDREIVFTPIDGGDVTRLFIWRMDERFMKASAKNVNMVFKKLRLLKKADTVKK